MDLGLRDKAAMVTGSSRGIGRAIALGLAAEGCRVAVVARGREELERAVEEVRACGVEAIALAADLSVAGEAGRAVEEAAAAFGGLDILVNNVGGGRGERFLESTDEQFQQTLDLNVFAAIRASRAAVPHMRRQGAGAIVHIASIYGREGGGRVPYNVAKAGVISLGKQMALELAPFRIRVNSVAPGSILFPGGSWERRMMAEPEAMAEFARREMPLGWGKPKDVANVAVFLASERAGHVTGACWVVDGGQGRSNI